MTKLLKADTSGRVPYPDATIEDLNVLEGIRWSGGTRLRANWPVVTIAVTDGYECPEGLPDYINTIQLDVVSESLRRVLESVQAEVEFLPVTLKYRGNLIEGRYFAVNPLVSKRVVDLERSDVEVDDELGMVLGAKRIVLDDAAIGDAKWIMADELSRIVVSEQLVSAVQESGCTGMAFVDPTSVQF